MTDQPIRIPPLPRDQWTDAARDVFAYWGEPGAWENGSSKNLPMVLATHPDLGAAYNVFGKHVLLGSTLPVRPRELAVLRVSWHMKAPYEWHYHVGYGLAAGMTMDEIGAIRVGPEAGSWNAEDRAVLEAVDQLWEVSRISDATWAALSDHFDEKQLMDLVFTIGQYVMLTWAINAFGVQLEDDVDRVGFDLKTQSGNPPGVRLRPGETGDWEKTK